MDDFGIAEGKLASQPNKIFGNIDSDLASQNQSFSRKSFEAVHLVMHLVVS